MQQKVRLESNKHYYLIIGKYLQHTRNNKGNQTYCQPVTTNEGPALDSRAPAKDHTAESDINGSSDLGFVAHHGYGQTM